MIGRKRFTRDRQGKYRTGLVAGERELLKALPGEVQSLLDERHPSTKRVFPVAYPDDESAESEYREMMGAHLLNRHRDSLDTLVATADDVVVGETEIHQWLDALEVMRLVVGTQLDVSEEQAAFDESDPFAPQLAIYHYLSMLQGEIIDALSQSLPVEGTRHNTDDL